MTFSYPTVGGASAILLSNSDRLQPCEFTAELSEHQDLLGDASFEKIEDPWLALMKKTGWIRAFMTIIPFSASVGETPTSQATALTFYLCGVLTSGD